MNRLVCDEPLPELRVRAILAGAEEDVVSNGESSGIEGRRCGFGSAPGVKPGARHALIEERVRIPECVGALGDDVGLALKWIVNGSNQRVCSPEVWK